MMRYKRPFEPKLAEKFGEKVGSVLKKLIINQRGNMKLANLRDWLLPMLMNGQVTMQTIKD